MQHIICFIKTVCILGGMSSNGPSTRYFWNEGNGWEYGGDMKHPRYGHVAVTQASSVRTNDFERPRSNYILTEDPYSNRFSLQCRPYTPLFHPTLTSSCKLY